ncbi:two-component regulator propeller domain-containing protein [Desulfobacterales bacterium HSG16]|nr:two-component regulator propeller domain-containing protein [Desulfobacterales bacterium HSG16]
MNQPYKITLCSLFIFLSFALNLYAEHDGLKFERISLSEGLSQSTVFGITQDNRGFMWFGTRNGLNRYDGYQFTIFEKNLSDSNSLSNNFVWSLIKDRKGYIWIGTHGGGLDRFDPETEKFTHFKNDPANQNSLSHDTVVNVMEDSAGRIWICTDGGGLNRLNPATGNFIRYRHDPADSSSISGNRVWALAEDRQGTIWAGTSESGLNSFDPATEKFTRYVHDPENENSLSHNAVWSILEDKNDNLWIGTFGGGLNRFDRKNNFFLHYQHDENDPESLPDDYVWTVFADSDENIYVGMNDGLAIFDPQKKIFTHYPHIPNKPDTIGGNQVKRIFEDNSGIIWIGTYFGGISKLDRKKEKFALLRNDPDNPDSLINNAVYSIYEDDSDTLWIATNGGGVSRLYPKTDKFSHYAHDPNNSDSISTNAAMCITGDKNGFLWIGTFAGGLNRLNPETGKFTRFRHKKNQNSLSSDTIFSIYEDKFGMLWIGTWKGGLDRFDPTTSTFVNYKNEHENSESVGHNFIQQIYEDSRNRLWVGTAGSGLDLFDRTEEKFEHLEHDPKNEESISDNNVYALFEDSKGFLWVGTGNGLNRLNTDTKKFTRYSTQDGLPSGTIMGILKDDRSNLWISTKNGLCKFNTVTKIFRNYDSFDGLQGREFIAGSAFKTRGNKMFFGGINGLNCFYPENVRDNSFKPPVVLTNIKILNLPAALKKPAFAVNNLSLTWKDNIISFEFAALNYSNTKKNMYAYMMEGFDNNWTYTNSAMRNARYTNLDPGRYIFKVKAANNDGVWNEQGKSVELIISPPWWDSAWFIVSVTVFFVLLAFGIYLMRIKSVKAHKQKLETLVNERTCELAESNAQLQQEIIERKRIESQLRTARDAAEVASHAKSEFLANMSHEIRTPMNAILGFTEILSELLTERKQKLYLSNVMSAGKSLLTLINDILDLSKIEAGKLTIECNSFNPHSLFMEIKSIFSQKSSEKGLDLIIDIDEELPMFLLLDEIRLRQVIFNLIGNAVKFTDAGYIRLSVGFFRTSDDKNKIDFVFSVEDTGIGISEEQQIAIFGKFEQQKGQSHAIYGGTGLGLAITKRLLEIMNGSISVKSELEKGSRFVVKIRDVEICSADDMISNEQKGQDIDSVIFEKATILTIDDVKINRDLVAGVLEKYDFTLLEAENGREGIEVARKFMPDLILMDIKMPVMGGREATLIIKQDKDLCKIPVIASTASSMKEEEKEISDFSDGYIRKPFTKSILITELMRFLPHFMPKKENTLFEQIEDIDKEPFDLAAIKKGEIKDKIKDVEKLLVSLDEELVCFQKLRHTLLISNIESFGLRMQNLGEKHNAGTLEKFGEILVLQTDSFEVDKIPQTLDIFPDLVTKIRNLS